MLSKESVEAKFNDFSKALKTFDEALQQEYSEYIRDSCILRFEYCFELAWKVLKLVLEFEDKPSTSATPRI